MVHAVDRMKRMSGGRGIVVAVISVLVGAGCTNHLAQARRQVTGLTARYTASPNLFTVSPTSGEPPATAEDISDAYDKMLQGCGEARQEAYRRAHGLRWTTIILSGIGSIAGAVVVPGLAAANAMANQVWISSFGGVSGALNPITVTMNSVGLSYQSEYEKQQAFEKKWAADIDAYNNATDPGEQLKKLRAAIADCEAYANDLPPPGTTTAGGDVGKTPDDKQKAPEAGGEK
jgi:hypothetical protein